MSHPQSPITKKECLRVVALLRALGAVGEEHAIPRRRLLEHLPYSDRHLRRIASEAVSEHEMEIGTCGEGYYLMQSQADVDRAIAECQSRRSHLERRSMGLRNIKRRLPAPELASAGGKLF